MITWDKPNERYYQHGLDRGVLYIPTKDPVPWNGLTGLEEATETPQSTIYYRDGQIYLADVDASDFQAKVTALYYPNEFAECLGIPEVTDGLYADNQKPKRFDLSYRSLIGSGTKGDMFGYQIHLVYKCMASINTRQRNTIGKDTTPTEFAFDLVCTPVKLAGFRPTAHYVIDTRGMSASLVADLEAILYGDDVTVGRMPTPQELFDLMNYGPGIVVTDHGDGTFSIEGSNSNVMEVDPHYFQVNNINATAPDVNGEYVISDGGNTTVVVE